MKTLCDQQLVDELRKKCNLIKKRLWISSPYVGKKKPFYQILGDKWKREKGIDFRLLVDYSNPNNFNFDTLKHLFEFNNKKFSIRTLTSLHAKIYIFDDECLVTSANLTPTAYQYRCEIGIFLDKEESKTAINIFNSYWIESKELLKSEIKKIKGSVPKIKDGNEFVFGFKKRNKLPEFEESQGWLKLQGYSSAKDSEKLGDFKISKNSEIQNYSFLGTPRGSKLKENDTVILLRMYRMDGRPIRAIYGRAKVDIPNRKSKLNLLNYIDKISNTKDKEEKKRIEESIKHWSQGFWIKDLELIIGDTDRFIDFHKLQDSNGNRLINPLSISSKSHITLNDNELKIINKELDKRLPKKRKLFNPQGIWLNKYLSKKDKIKKENFRIKDTK